MAPAIETLTPRHRPHHPTQRDRTNGQSAPTFSFLELIIVSCSINVFLSFQLDWKLEQWGLLFLVAQEGES